MYFKFNLLLLPTLGKKAGKGEGEPLRRLAEAHEHLQKAELSQTEVRPLRKRGYIYLCQRLIKTFRVDSELVAFSGNGKSLLFTYVNEWEGG